MGNFSLGARHTWHFMVKKLMHALICKIVGVHNYWLELSGAATFIGLEGFSKTGA